jgi:hypothetical protein
VLHAHLPQLAAITNLKPHIMKNLIICLLILLVFGCIRSNDELQLETGFDNKMSQIDFENIYNVIDFEKEIAKKNGLNSKSSGENGNGVYIVPFYSNNLNGNTWFAIFQIPETSLFIFIDFPQDGDDRAIVFSEDEMMVNFSSQGPRMFIRDAAQGWKIVYSNWCDENKTGLYQMRGRTTYIPVDQDNDGTIDFYWWGPNAPGTVVDKNFIMHIKSTLTDAHSFNGNCPATTEEVDLNYVLQLQNGRLRESGSLD